MQHTRTCPHNCEACKETSRWKMMAWNIGGCIVCGNDRQANAYACMNCWVLLSVFERNEVFNLFINKGLENV